MVYRTKKTKGFVRIDNGVVQDERLSFRARGLLGYVLSRPDDWTHSAESLSRGASEGRDAVRAALKELAALGYARCSRVRTSGGQMTTTWDFFEAPTPENPSSDNASPETENPSSVVGAPTPEKPTPGKPSDGKPDAGFPVHLQTTAEETTVTKTNIKETTQREGGVGQPPLLAAVDLEIVEVDLKPVARGEILTNSPTAFRQFEPVIESLAYRNKMRTAGVREAIEEWAAIKFRWFAKDGVTTETWHLHFNSWLAGRDGERFRVKHADYERFGWDGEERDHEKEKQFAAEEAERERLRNILPATWDRSTLLYWLNGHEYPNRKWPMFCDRTGISRNPEDVEKIEQRIVNALNKGVKFNSIVELIAAGARDARAHALIEFLTEHETKTV